MSNIYHIQSTYPSAQARSAPRQLKCQSPVRTAGGSGLAQLERVQECGEVLLVGDEEDVFPLEVEDVRLASVRSPESGWSQWSESEPDEGIDIPAKFREKTQVEVGPSQSSLISSYLLLIRWRPPSRWVSPGQEVS